MKVKRAFFYGLSAFMIFSVSASFASEAQSVKGAEAQKRLMDGNKRFVEGKMTHPDQDLGRRTGIVKGQNPFAIIVSCSDSRVPPEVVFDQGLGDLFVIRIAGNVLNDEAIGSIEYAVEHLGSKYLMVLGHESCGAVAATVKGGEAPGHIGSIVKAIQPAVEAAKKQQGDLMDNSVKANVSMVVQKLKSNAPILEHAVKKGDLVIEGARYDLDEGTVSMIP